MALELSEIQERTNARQTQLSGRVKCGRKSRLQMHSDAEGKAKIVKNPLIKIIKRKDAEATAVVKSLSSRESFLSGRSKAGEERQLNRKIGSTVSTWVDERREKDRMAKIDAVRKMLTGEILLSPA